MMALAVRITLAHTTDSPELGIRGQALVRLGIPVAAPITRASVFRTSVSVLLAYTVR
jgi:hypothetical protein